MFYFSCDVYLNFYQLLVFYILRKIWKICGLNKNLNIFYVVKMEPFNVISHLMTPEPSPPHFYFTLTRFTPHFSPFSPENENIFKFSYLK